MVTTLGAIQVRPLTRQDATPEIAVGVMTTQLDAYVARFGDCHRASLAETLHADVQNPAHLQQTLDQLQHGPDDDWYWVAALEGIDGKVVMHGFALCIVRPQEIFLAEIHTRPGSQRRGLATAMLKELIRFVCDGSRGVAVTGLPVTLYVGRQRSNDNSEHPFAWYLSIGFVPDGRFDWFPLGKGMLIMDGMRAAIGVLLPKLVVDSGSAVD